MFSKIFSELKALYKFMFLSGELVDVETLAKFQDFLSPYGKKLVYMDGEVYFEGIKIPPRRSYLKFVRKHTEVEIHLSPEEMVKVRFKCGQLYINDKAA